MKFKIYNPAKFLAIAAACTASLVSHAQLSRITDSSALVALYGATSGSTWTNKTNWLSTQPIETWYGVGVNADGRVSSVVLPNNNLVGGPIPNGLAVDSALVTLDLSQNSVTGALPYFSDPSMVTLNLSHNQLTGTINYYSLNYLQNLDLSYNLLAGNAAALGNYPNIVHLAANNNQFNTGMPSFFGSNSLITLNLANNLFTGTIPFLGSNSLEMLDLSNNQFSGSISFWPLPMLKQLSLGHNQLSGSIQPLANFFNATSIDASYNLFTGSAPYFGLQTTLGLLNLSHNQLSGSLPYFGNPVLHTLNLSYNGISGSIGYYDLPSLVNLQLDHNQLTGPLNINSPASLRVFTAHANMLSGNITPGFFQLTTLRLDSNKYTFNEIEPKFLVEANPFIYDKQDTVLPVHLNLVGLNTMSVSAGGTLGNNQYNWYNGDVFEATVIGDSTYHPLSGGTYTVKVTNLLVPNLTLSGKSTTLLLPIKFASFAVGLLQTSNGLAADVAWKTASESNNKFFEIERSLDGTHFVKVGTVNTSALNGNSTVGYNYRFQDDLANLRGTIFYRLKQVDIDDKSQYSKIASLNIDKLGAKAITLNMYPNPVTSSSQLIINSLASAKVAIKVVSANGAIVMLANSISLQKGANNIPINWGHYPAGTYILQVLDASNQVLQTLKISK